MEPGSLSWSFDGSNRSAVGGVSAFAHESTGSHARVGFVTLIGLVACITTNVPYWNWYGFPTSYTAAYMFTQIVNYVIVGVIAALVMKPRNGGGLVVRCGVVSCGRKCSGDGGRVDQVIRTTGPARVLSRREERPGFGMRGPAQRRPRTFQTATNPAPGDPLGSEKSSAG